MLKNKVQQPWQLHCADEHGAIEVNKNKGEGACGVQAGGGCTGPQECRADRLEEGSP